jgi:hypothetical protein
MGMEEDRTRTETRTNHTAYTAGTTLRLETSTFVPVPEQKE